MTAIDASSSLYFYQVVKFFTQVKNIAAERATGNGNNRAVFKPRQGGASMSYATSLPVFITRTTCMNRRVNREAVSARHVLRNFQAHSGSQYIFDQVF
ncbi:hypothetical protein [Paenochrobactrum glaciei]|uniref:hypothetical protein n=1 Tax=Paenochrobactrum glaciei TaxID=486407 RepID=UPI0031D91563